MKLKITENRSGFTLVELMVSTGLFGYCALMMGTLFAEGSRLVVSVRAQADFNSEMILFNDVVDTYIANTTRIRTCLCGAPGTCLYDGTGIPTSLPKDGSKVPADCGTYSNAKTPTDPACDFLDFDTDVANDPTQEATGSCFGYSGWDQFSGANISKQASTHPVPAPVNDIDPTDPDFQIYPKGCKERMKLRFIPPTANTPSGTRESAGVPGEIQLVKISVGGAEQILSKLTGVYAFQCGFEAKQNGGANGAPTSFRIDINAKTKRAPATAGEATSMESWSPYDSNFPKGLHKILSLNIQYRNLSSEAIQFGRTQSFRGCQADGTAIGAGTSADAANCCSGYIDRFGSGLCIPQTACLPAKTVIATAGPSGDWEKCCSHKTATINGVPQCI